MFIIYLIPGVYYTEHVTKNQSESLLMLGNYQKCHHKIKVMARRDCVQQELNSSLTNIRTFLSLHTAAYILVKQILQLFKHLNTFPDANLCASANTHTLTNTVLPRRECIKVKGVEFSS